MQRLILIALFTCLGFSVSFAQDSVKKAAPVKPRPVYKTYKYHGYAYRKYKSDSAAKAALAHAPLKPDSVPQPAAAPADKSLNGQYQYLLSKVYHYQQPLISALWKNASDTLSANHRKLNAALGKISGQNKAIDSLKTELSNQNEAVSHKDAIDIFGIEFSEATYNLIVWGLVALFGIIAIVVIARSGSYRREARYRIQLYNELEEEFKVYKTKANDKEKKLARELQTERNKLDELLGRG